MWDISFYCVKYFMKELIESDKFQQQLRIKELQSKSTVLALSNYQIERRFGPTITTTIQNDTYERFKPDCKSFSVARYLHSKF